MSKADIIIDFAAESKFNLTGSLSHEQVELLAKAWLPEIRFHEKEKYHPISLNDYFVLPGSGFAARPQNEQDKYKFTVRVGKDGLAVYEKFVPQVLKIDGPLLPLRDGAREYEYRRTQKVLSNGEQILTELFNDAINEDAEVSHGNGKTGSDFFFASTNTIKGNSTPTGEDPFQPRHPIKIIAEYKVLIDLLQHELLVDNEVDYPKIRDKIRGGFDITKLFFPPIPPNIVPISRGLARSILLELITAKKSGGDQNFQIILNRLPDGYKFNNHAWVILTRHAFLEFHFYYAYSNWQEYGNNLFTNYHEGDLEGCCLVFDHLEVEATFSAPEPVALDVKPLSIITSVHEEYQGLDEYKELAAAHAKEDAVVWVALGSHATYTSVGNHDVVNTRLLFRTGYEYISLAVIPLWPVIVLVAVLEHFVDVEDETSDDGIYINSLPPNQGDSRVFDKTVEITPFSLNQNIYAHSTLDDLGVRSYPGKLGGTSGIKNKSSNFKNKSGRFFRKLLNRMSTTPVID
ncbi:hypothetical protein [Neolewinella sp.]|uniref:hypothetical protein n=1 Tax=Neolewinella sp. TaxID=2993543 RepID=UPI003B529D2A